MKEMPPVGILAGGFGTRLAEETDLRPKPMVEVGGYPLLWHLMKSMAAHGAHEFVVALGYKSEVVKDFFANYRARSGDLVVDLATGDVQVERPPQEDWKVALVDTGLDTQTGGRVKSILRKTGRRTIVTYGDGLSTIDIGKLVAFHEQHGKLATVTAVHPPARFGEIRFDGDRVSSFAEKPQLGEGWINGGFFVLEPEVESYVPDMLSSFESVPLNRLTQEGQLMAYRHDGFWQCADTLRDLRMLQRLWDSGKAPWRGGSG